jgi:uncharacterized protein (TIGR02596 family)
MSLATRLVPRGKRGFTLVELIVVMVIMVLLATLAFFSFGTVKGTNVTESGNMVMEDMAYARELAVSNNQPTEVWFFQPQGGTALTALRIYLVDKYGNSTSFGPVHHLPATVILDSGTFLSPLITAGNLKTWTGGQTKPTIPGYQTSYNAYYVRFMPDGSTTLSSSSQWYLTLHELRLGDQLPAVPANYAMVSLDPVLGTVSLYRP